MFFVLGYSVFSSTKANNAHNASPPSSPSKSDVRLSFGLRKLQKGVQQGDPRSGPPGTSPIPIYPQLTPTPRSTTNPAPLLPDNDRDSWQKRWQRQPPGPRGQRPHPNELTIWKGRWGGPWPWPPLPPQQCPQPLPQVTICGVDSGCEGDRGMGGWRGTADGGWY